MKMNTMFHILECWMINYVAHGMKFYDVELWMFKIAL